MSQVKVDPNTSELIRENGAFQRVSGAEEIAQHVRCRFRILKGEVYLDKEAGIDYELVFTKGMEVAEIAGLWRDACDGTPGIDKVIDVLPEQSAIQRANRELEFTVEAEYDLDLLVEEGPLHDKFAFVVSA